MRSHSCTIAALAIGALAMTAASATAQSVHSIGQPPIIRYEGSLLAPLGGADARVRAGFLARRPLIDPVAGLLGVRAEAYATHGSGFAGGAEALLESRAVGLSAGVDWNATHGVWSPVVSFQSAIRRGGLIGHGSMLRADWTPRAAAKFAIGVTMPIGQPLAGRTRPKQTHVRLSALVPPAADVSVPRANVAPDLQHLLDLIGAYENTFSPRAEHIIRSDSRGYAATLGAYDSTLRRVFGSVETANLARRTLLDRVVMPLDSLFGQAKENPTDLSPLKRAAAAAFASHAGASSSAPAFSALLDAVEASYGNIVRDAQDSRFAWMPLEFALGPSQFSDQTQVDSLLARAVGHPFTDQNALTYLLSSDLPLEIARSIYATRRYHVLWTHDFTGRKESGAIDNVAYSMVADAYLPALTAAVKRYDSTGVLPAYIILQDEYFYEPRDNRLWMNILENPLHASMRLKGDSGQREAHLVERQRELQAAVAASSRLQRDARAGGDADRWLREHVKVHVNIVEPADFSFRSSHIIPGIAFTPDNVMRDHRKLVFYDLDEADPYRGAMMIMGVGIGEHYASDTWEDRGYRVRGPATLEARRAVRETLLRNGFREDQIPEPLRAVENAKAVEANANTREYVGRALQVHNEVGFARKESSVARAMLHNLAPPGSVIIVPDPMWLSDTWAGMLAAAAARGCRVYIVAPAAANAPSPQAPLMAVQQRVLSRVLALRDSLAPVIRAAGGDLRVGMFAAHAQIDDPAGRQREIREGLARAPWIRQVIPFDNQTLAVLEQPGVLASTGRDATSLARDDRPREPQLHQKSQLIARPGAISALLRQPGWDRALAQSLRYQAQATAKFSDQLGYSTPDVDTTATRRNDALLRGYEQSVPEAERKLMSFYFSLGTQNQDDRGIVSDGEATMIVSGAQASAGLVDLFTLMARSTWVSTPDELARYVQPPRGWLARIAWRVRAAF